MKNVLQYWPYVNTPMLDNISDPINNTLLILRHLFLNINFQIFRRLQSSNKHLDQYFKISAEFMRLYLKCNFYERSHFRKKIKQTWRGCFYLIALIFIVEFSESSFSQELVSGNPLLIVFTLNLIVS